MQTLHYNVQNKKWTLSKSKYVTFYLQNMSSFAKAMLQYMYYYMHETELSYPTSTMLSSIVFINK